MAGDEASAEERASKAEKMVAELKDLLKEANDENSQARGPTGSSALRGYCSKPHNIVCFFGRSTKS